MIIVAYIILAFTALQFIVVLLNFVTRTSLAETGEKPDEAVSVLIPARNEENNIVNILNDLINQDYSNIEIIVFDDQSEDRTADIVSGFMLRDDRIKLIRSGGLPDGWLGKNHACHSLAKDAGGKYLLFLDADVRVKGNIINKAVSFAKRHDLALISIFPKQIIVSAGERATVPVMNYILLSLLPLILVRRSRYPSLAAANGQFMFFRADAYRSVEPHMIMKDKKVEDILTARHFKRRGLAIACLVGAEDISCRMYTGFRDAAEGFSKNVVEFFGNSFMAALMFWLITTLGFMPVLFFLPPAIFLAYAAIYALTRMFISAASRQNIFYNLLLIIPLQFSMGFFIYKAFINRFFRKYQWKGRSIS